MRRILSAVQIAPNAESLLNETQFGGWRQPARLPWIAIGILDIIYIFNHSVTIVIIFCVVSQQSLFQAEPLFERDKWIVKWTVVNPARPIITKALTNELSRLIWRPRSHILTGVMLLFMPFLIAEKPHYFMS